MAPVQNDLIKGYTLSGAYPLRMVNELGSTEVENWQISWCLMQTHSQQNDGKSWISSQRL